MYRLLWQQQQQQQQQHRRTVAASMHYAIRDLLAVHCKTALNALSPQLLNDAETVHAEDAFWKVNGGRESWMNGGWTGGRAGRWAGRRVDRRAPGGQARADVCHLAIYPGWTARYSYL